MSTAGKSKSIEEHLQDAKTIGDASESIKGKVDKYQKFRDVCIAFSKAAKIETPQDHLIALLIERVNVLSNETNSLKIQMARVERNSKESKLQKQLKEKENRIAVLEAELNAKKIEADLFKAIKDEADKKLSELAKQIEDAAKQQAEQVLKNLDSIIEAKVTGVISVLHAGSSASSAQGVPATPTAAPVPNGTTTTTSAEGGKIVCTVHYAQCMNEIDMMIGQIHKFDETRTALQEQYNRLDALALSNATRAGELNDNRTPLSKKKNALDAEIRALNEQISKTADARTKLTLQQQCLGKQLELLPIEEKLESIDADIARCATEGETLKERREALDGDLANLRKQFESLLVVINGNTEVLGIKEVQLPQDTDITTISIDLIASTTQSMLLALGNSKDQYARKLREGTATKQEEIKLERFSSENATIDEIRDHYLEKIKELSLDRNIKHNLEMVLPTCLSVGSIEQYMYTYGVTLI